MKPPVGSGARALADVVAGAAGAGSSIPARVEPATVATVTAGAAADGNALVTVTWRGATVPVAYLASYTPVVGHTVLVLVQPPGLVIVGRVIGTPPT